MSRRSAELEEKLASIGLETYHSMLVSRGYWTWESVLELSEEDLESLQFKRGHRRRLQRHIATDRGYPTYNPLANARSCKNDGRKSNSLLPRTNGSMSRGQGKPGGHQSPTTNSPQPSPARNSSDAGYNIEMRDWPFACAVGQMWQATDNGEGSAYGHTTAIGVENEDVFRQYIRTNSEGNQSDTTDFQSGWGVKMENVARSSQEEAQASLETMWEFINF